MQTVTKAQNVAAILLTVFFLIFVVVGGYYLRSHSTAGARNSIGASGSLPLASRTVNGLSVNFKVPAGQLRAAENDVLIEFRNHEGQVVDVGDVKLVFDMNMPGMVMHSGSTIQPTGVTGQYRAKIKPDMAGAWVATLEYKGPQGTGRTAFPVDVKP